MILTKSKFVRQVAGVAETINLLGLRLLLTSRTGFSMYPGIVLRSFASLGGKCPWQSKTIGQLCPEAFGQRISVEHLPEGGETVGATSSAELAHLALLTRALRPRVVFEIGTYRGRTALNFALNSPADCIVYTMDLPPDSKLELPGAADAELASSAKPGADYQNKDVADKIKQIYSDSTTFDFSPFAGQVDLFFVDGAHHYEAVVSDTRNALRSIRAGGVIVWHDFANYGDFADVTRALLDILPHHRLFQIEDTQLAMYRAD
ncbi:MAG TPA: class I SAM-dependent methyltransferase [Myxococcota bacterium]|nr:class I SAM-dependent methyltransferase [Myxococcota bacterium]